MICYFPKQNGKHPPNILANSLKDVGPNLVGNEGFEDGAEGDGENDTSEESQNGKQSLNIPENGLKTIGPDLSGMKGLTGCANDGLLLVGENGFDVVD